ncbi:MAG: hypothetical protein PUP91_27360 [Rhizonema sp. PD37]|nr:hypothetical protein [Rhizonema sp. PD37]
MSHTYGKAVKGHRGFVSQGKDIGGEVKVIGCKFPPEVDAVLRTLPNRSEKLRQWVIQCMLEEGLLDQNSSTQSPNS